MRTRFISSITVLLVMILIAGCGKDPELTRFKTNFDNFCTNVSTLDASINNIDPSADNAVSKLLKYIRQMDEQFNAMANLDFPEDFDYLEDLADEAAEYMTEAADAYDKAFSTEGYDEAMNEYAYKNYKRAYKRLQIILIYLHGEEPTEADLISE